MFHQCKLTGIEVQVSDQNVIYARSLSRLETAAAYTEVQGLPMSHSATSIS